MRWDRLIQSFVTNNQADTQKTARKRTKSAFSLVEISIVLAILSVVLAGALPVITESTRTADSDDTLERFESIERALTAYSVANSGALPCPALLNSPVNSAAFGQAVAFASGSCGTPAAGQLYEASGVSMGMVPTKTLGLPDEFAFDGWGRRIAYHISLNNISAETTGSIQVLDQANTVRTSSAVYALVSHGANGHGGFTISGARYNASSSNAQELENCACTNAAADSALTPASGTAAEGEFDNELVQGIRINTNAVATTYDDIVRYYEREQIDILSGDGLTTGGGGGGGGGGGTSAAESEPVSFGATSFRNPYTNPATGRVPVTGFTYTENHDEGDNFDATTGIFTAPDDGFYHFSGMISRTDSPGNFYATLLLNGSAYIPNGTYGSRAGNASIPTSTFSNTLELNQGDTVQLAYYTDAGLTSVSIALTISGFKVGNVGATVPIQEVIEGWPYGFTCINDNGNTHVYTISGEANGTDSGRVSYYHDTGAYSRYITFNSDGSYYTHLNASGDCTNNSWSISDLEANNRTFALPGGGGGTSAQVSFNAFRDFSGTSAVNGIHNMITNYTLSAAGQHNIGNDLNASTGIFTAPVDGVYSFQGTVHLNTAGISSNNFYASLVMNGAVVAEGSRSQGSNIPISTIARTLEMSAGDQISLNYYIDTNIGSLAYAHARFSGYLVTSGGAANNTSAIDYGWPDVIKCTLGSSSNEIGTMIHHNVSTTAGRTYVQTGETSRYLTFASNGTQTGANGDTFPDCNGKSIAQLDDDGQTVFFGNNGLANSDSVTVQEFSDMMIAHGTKTLDLGTNWDYCALSESLVEDGGSADDGWGCTVEENGSGMWELITRKGAPGMSSVSCRAQCISGLRAAPANSNNGSRAVAMRNLNAAMPMPPSGPTDWADAIVCLTTDGSNQPIVYELEYYTPSSSLVTYRFTDAGGVDYRVSYNVTTGARTAPSPGSGVGGLDCPGTYAATEKVFYGETDYNFGSCVNRTNTSNFNGACGGLDCVIVNCLAGERVLGGGCSHGSNFALRYDFPPNNTTWQCVWTSANADTKAAYAICCPE